MPGQRSRRTTSVQTTSRRRQPRRRLPSHDQIALRAYAISQSPGAGDALANWLRAEAELAAS